MNLWEQQPNETAAQYKAFRFYLQHRSIEAAYREYILHRKQGKAGKRVGQKASGAFLGWSKLFDWDNRVRAYDKYILDEVNKNEAVAMKESDEKRLALYRANADIGHSKIMELVQNVKDPRQIDLVLNVVRYYEQHFNNRMERSTFVEMQQVLSQLQAEPEP